MPSYSLQAFAYLEVVEAAVSSAVAPLMKGEGEKVRKLASLALVESMNTWVDANEMPRGFPLDVFFPHGRVFFSPGAHRTRKRYGTYRNLLLKRNVVGTGSTSVVLLPAETSWLVEFDLG